MNWIHEALLTMTNGPWFQFHSKQKHISNVRSFFSGFSCEHRYFAEYRESNCKFDCLLRRMLETCKCLPYYYGVHASTRNAAVCQRQHAKCLALNYCMFASENSKCTAAVQYEKHWLDSVVDFTLFLQGLFMVIVRMVQLHAAAWVIAIVKATKLLSIVCN